MRTIIKLLINSALLLLLNAGIAHSASVSFTPLSAQYNVPISGNSEGAISFPVIGGMVMISVPASKDATLQLTLPSGKKYSNFSATSPEVEFYFSSASDENAFGLLRDEWHINMPTASVGQYYLSFTNTQSEETTLPVTVHHLDSDLLSGISVGHPQRAQRAEEPMVLVAFIYDGTTPVANATVSASLLTTDGAVVANTILNNDGVLPDLVTGDGTYTGLITPDIEGTFFVRIDIQGKTALGHPYHATHGRFLTVKEANEINLTGDFQDQGVDTNNDGLFDELFFKFDYSGQYKDAAYGLQVILNASNGQEVSGYGKLINGELIVSIPATIMTQLEVDGPYQVAAVILNKEGRLLERQDNIGQTQLYVRTDWARKALQFTGLKEQAVDIDSDGLIDALEVAVTVESLVNGDFGFSLDLRSSDGAMIATTAVSSIGLQKGSNDLIMRFDGIAIGQSEQNGPFIIGNALLYPNFTSGATAYADILGSTQPYQCREFVQCSSDNIQTLLDNLDTAVVQGSIAWGVRSVLKLELSLVRNAIEQEHTRIALFNLNSFITSVKLSRGLFITRVTADHLLALAEELHDALKQ